VLRKFYLPFGLTVFRHSSRHDVDSAKKVLAPPRPFEGNSTPELESVTTESDWILLTS
jgi:hypothetical protein